MTINLTREDFEQAIKSGASVFEGNTIVMHAKKHLKCTEPKIGWQWLSLISLPVS